MLKHIFYTKHIFDPCVEIKIIFLHISKYNIRRKLFPFTKSALISFTLKKHLKTLENFAWRVYSSPNIISYTIITIGYLSKSNHPKNVLFNINNPNLFPMLTLFTLILYSTSQTIII